MKKKEWIGFLIASILFKVIDYILFNKLENVEPPFDVTSLKRLTENTSWGALHSKIF